jgi:hypothetical protein
MVTRRDTDEQGSLFRILNEELRSVYDTGITNGPAGSIPVNPDAGSAIHELVTAVGSGKTPLDNRHASTDRVNRIAQNPEPGETAQVFMKIFFQFCIHIWITFCQYQPLRKKFNI